MINGVFEFKEAIISYEAAGAAGTCTISTDMPLPWATRTTITLPVTTGKGTHKAQYQFEGKHIEVMFQSGAAATDVLKPYDMHMMVRQIGVHLSGGETWRTGQLPINI